MSDRHRLGHRGRALIAFTALCALLAPVAASAQKLVIVVRHAERADQGAAAGQMMNQNDPPLSAAGQARAAKLAALLADANVKAVFATEYRRTQDTVKPLADKLGLRVQVVPGRETANLIGLLKSAPADGVAVIAGHSNTVPAIIKALGGPELTIAENEYDNLFIIEPSTGAFTRLRFD
jgi:phosphohistidine phosphatase SixA